jgi:hypothetical protein
MHTAQSFCWIERVKRNFRLKNEDKIARRARASPTMDNVRARRIALYAHRLYRQAHLSSSKALGAEFL